MMLPLNAITPNKTHTARQSKQLEESGMYFVIKNSKLLARPTMWQ
jgi:hypothetical protein